jgi:hypothetical protein
MNNPQYFTDAHNRSERAKQVMLLAPALADSGSRFRLLASIHTADAPPISREESDSSRIMHFVWVLRDTFTFERDEAARVRGWAPFRERWANLMALPTWANEAPWWRHPSGSYRGDEEYAVHPCHRDIGWTSRAIRTRIRNFGLGAIQEEMIAILSYARQVMNTECDCLIQTPHRLVIIECKDKTGFSTEQRDRQLALSSALARLLQRIHPTIHIDLSTDLSDSDLANKWSWQDVASTQEAQASA